MGTRGIVGFRINGEDKLTYNHYDSYPSGLGANIVSEINVLLLNLPFWKEKTQSLKLVDGASTPTKEEIDRLIEFTDLGVSKQSTEDWYCLLRKTQGEVVKILTCGYMIDSNDFILDSLFCEWGYIINFDDNTLEIYKGFQEKKHDDGRYAKLYEGNQSYYPCALIKVYKLNEIPKDWIDEVDPQEDEDDEDDE